MQVREHIPLAPLTTMGVGGPARYFVEAKTAEEVQEAVRYARQKDAPLFVLGGGSNLVVSDRGWPGLVLKVAIAGIEAQKQTARFEVGAGENWDGFVATAVGLGCQGVECLSGIPGSVGGTPVQNVGAYGQQVSETIESVQVFDLRDHQIRDLCAEACAFSYRSSIFNTTARDRYIILRVTYLLVPGAVPPIRYADLKQYFDGRKQRPSLAETREAVRQIRASKAMLITPGDEDSRSAGSFFKNPVLTAEQYEELTRRAGARGLRIPSYPALEAQRKLSAAWLVEHSGFAKGYRLGQVRISRKHALALVNCGGATAPEVMALKDEIQRCVEQMWGIRLEPEPVFVGF
jgi:UDP-N-acetylmuramate dehydrogenase